MSTEKHNQVETQPRHSPPAASEKTPELQLDVLPDQPGNQRLLGLFGRPAAASGVVQRCPTCGGAQTPCPACSEPDEQLVQPAREAGLPATRLPASVLKAVASSEQSGRSLPETTRSEMEQRFGHSFGDVRIHTDGQAARAAEAIRASAFTVGRQIWFGRNTFQPHETAGKGLLAHELAHTLQQRQSAAGGVQPKLRLGPVNDPLEREAEAAARAVVAGERMGRLSGTAVPAVRRNPIEFFARLFGGGTFSDEELVEYIGKIKKKGGILNNYVADNMARAIVQKWKTGDDTFDLSETSLRLLLMREMMSGYTRGDDERNVLEILERSDNNDLLLLLGSGGLSPAWLYKNFHGDEKIMLADFFKRRNTGGLAAALNGKVKPIGELVPRGTELGSTPPKKKEEKKKEESCSVRTPEKCPSYESWIQTFATLETYHSPLSSATTQTLGRAAAPSATATDPNANASQRRPKVLHANSDYLPTDRFIDGPTDKWVNDNLPPNLVEVAYMLPSDCADMAVILRHVWLVAHKRTELYKGWVCGSLAGDPRSKDVRDYIKNTLYSGNVKNMVASYADQNGRAIKDFATLQRLLHPGDVLVWEHQDVQGNRTGGHTLTIMALRRNEAGNVTLITALQGNQPINEAQAIQMRQADIAAGGNPPSVKTLRAAPGRRIEVSTSLRGNNLRDVNGVWTWGARTKLVAAGPPASAKRPKMQKPKGQPKIRRFTDYVPAFKKANSNALIGSLERALLEARAKIEGGGAIANADAEAVGQAAGERLWKLAKGAADLADESHFRRIQQFEGLIDRLAQDSRADATRATFKLLKAAFIKGARGGSTLDFTRSGQPKDTRIVKVLLTGFDPFNTANIRQAPRRGEWNPSGAAVLALDGQTLPVSQGVVAAVEGIVLPVSFDAFKAGIVEKMIEPHAQTVDAVITVSLDPGIPPGGAVDLEQYAVGVHRLLDRTLEAVPPPPQSQNLGPAIIGTSANLAQLAGETKRPAAQGQRAIPEPTVDSAIQLRFVDANAADAALKALGLPEQNASVVSISNTQALTQVVGSMQRAGTATSPGITFKAGNQTFTALIVRGPGGSFLSNEIAFRTQRLLKEKRPQQTPTAFHVHTMRGTAKSGDVIPQAQKTAKEKQKRQAALTLANQVRTDLIETLKRLVTAVAKRV